MSPTEHAKRKSKSPYIIPAFLVPKKDGSSNCVFWPNLKNRLAKC